jgi:hypothetical protein
MRRSIAVAALVGVLGAAGCGGGSHKPARRAAAPPATATPSVPARAADVAVVRGWADALRRGHVARADSLFSLPALVQNGTPPLPLTTRSEVHGFDLSLPCGARLLRTVAHHGYVLAEFRLTERRGPGGGHCDGTGHSAATAFRIVGGKIREWRRIVGLPGKAPPPPSATAPQT